MLIHALVCRYLATQQNTALSMERYETYQSNGACVHQVIELKIQWKPIWLGTQVFLLNDQANYTCNFFVNCDVSVIAESLSSFTKMINCMKCTAWCSAVCSLTSLDACKSCSCSVIRDPTSLHQAVHSRTCLMFRVPWLDGFSASLPCAPAPQKSATG